MIDHKMKTFINYMEQSIDDVDLTEPYEGLIVSNIFENFRISKHIQ